MPRRTKRSPIPAYVSAAGRSIRRGYARWRSVSTATTTRRDTASRVPTSHRSSEGIRIRPSRDFRSSGISRRSRLHAPDYPAGSGIARADVAKIKRGYPDSAESGFSFERDFAPLEPARHEIAIVAVNRQGGGAVLARKSLVPPAALSTWQPRSASRRADAAPPFFVLPGLSGIALGGASR